MSKKSTKFQKLQIPTGSRNKSIVTKFFSQTEQNSEQSLNKIDEIKSQPELFKISEITNNEENLKTSENNEKEILHGCSNQNENTNTTADEIKSRLLQFEKNPPVVIKRKATNKSSNAIDSTANKNTIKKFFNESNDDDFETPPPIKQQKKTNIISSNDNIKKPIKTKRKRQTKINNMLLRNEMLASKMLAEQSIAENVNPDDMQLALALSLSEMNTNDNETDEKLVSENLCKKFKKFEYKSSTNNDTYNFDFPFFVQNKSKGKWANKFTPLTLRNAEKQSQKVAKKIEDFLEQQIEQENIKNENYNEICNDIQVVSKFLINLKTNNNQIINKISLSQNEINDYYVNELFIPSKIKSGYLLKDYKKIPGRDLSPNRFDVINSTENNKNTNNEQIEQNEIVNETEQDKVAVEELPIVSISLESGIEKTNLLAADTSNTKTELINSNSSESYQNMERNISREVSPDLFADYDEMDVNNDLAKEEEEEKIKSLHESNIQVYENYSSDDDVKNHLEVEESENCANNISYKHISPTTIIENQEDIVDITQDDNSFDGSEYNFQSNKSVKTPSSEVDRIVLDSPRNILNSNTNLSQGQNCSQSSSLKISKNNINNSTESINIEKTECINNSKSSQISQKSKVSDDNLDNFDGTQNNLLDSDCEIILSDDEVNYSMRKTMNRIFESNIDENVSPITAEDELITSNCLNSTEIFDNYYFEKVKDFKSKSHNFSFIDLIMEKPDQVDSDDDCKQSQNSIKSCDNNSQIHLEISTQDIEVDEDEVKDMCVDMNSDDERDKEYLFDLRKIRAEYGILDEGTPTKCNPIASCSKVKKFMSDSFLKPTTSKAMLDYDEFESNDNTRAQLKRFPSTDGINAKEMNIYDEFDEFDKIVYGSPLKHGNTSPCNDVLNKPKDLDKLLTGEINLSQNNLLSSVSSDPVEFVYDNKMYLVKTENVPEKPDFHRMDYSKILKELYKYGLKPLKRKQAIIMLEYIYNQTHPHIEEETNQEDIESQEDEIEKEIKHKGIGKSQEEKYDSLKLRDCNGDVLLRINEISPEIENEEYYFPTVRSKKVSTCSLPLHLAWFNLVKSSDNLRELILHYEPIDLQEIYLFFKKLGYRYDPKDMKKFFDSRCIIFRYDLSNGTNNRHTKKLLPLKKRR